MAIDSAAREFFPRALYKWVAALVILGLAVGACLFWWHQQQTLRDCADCPEMVWIEPGSFPMGSNNLPLPIAAPRHVATIKAPFWIGKYEVTFAQWDACVADGGCNGYRPPEWDGCLWTSACKSEATDTKPGLWARGDRPVMNVSWHDAQAYVTWLSRKTGENYRLPSETEWEYAAQAWRSDRLKDTGGDVEIRTKVGFIPMPEQLFPWGNELTRKWANYGLAIAPDSPNLGGDVEGDDKWLTTAPVGRFPPNGFGLHDMQGNVWEWVEDCFEPGYRDRPAEAKEGQALVGCNEQAPRVMRGGSWMNPPDHLRPVQRNYHRPDFRMHVTGFRVARSEG